MVKEPEMTEELPPKFAKQEAAFQVAKEEYLRKKAANSHESAPIDPENDSHASAKKNGRQKQQEKPFKSEVFQGIHLTQERFDAWEQDCKIQMEEEEAAEKIGRPVSWTEVDYAGKNPGKDFHKIPLPYPLHYAKLENGEKIGYLDSGVVESEEERMKEGQVRPKE